MFPSGVSRAMEFLKSGDRAPSSGVYCVYHDGHRSEHFVTLLEGEVLPACVKCSDQVRFELVRAAKMVKEDEDFGSP